MFDLPWPKIEPMGWPRYVRLFIQRQPYHRQVRPSKLLFALLLPLLVPSVPEIWTVKVV